MAWNIAERRRLEENAVVDVHRHGCLRKERPRRAGVKTDLAALLHGAVAIEGITAVTSTGFPFPKMSSVNDVIQTGPSGFLVFYAATVKVTAPPPAVRFVLSPTLLTEMLG